MLNGISSLTDIIHTFHVNSKNISQIFVARAQGRLLGRPAVGRLEGISVGGKTCVFPPVFPPVFQVVLPSLTLRDMVMLDLSGVRHQVGSRGVLHMGLGSVCQVWATEWSHPRLLLHI